jgi:hypothetical protein
MNQNHDFKRIFFVMSIFDNTGLSYIFANQLNINIHSLRPVLKELLYDHFIQQWFTYVENSLMKLISNILSTESTHSVIPSNILPSSSLYGEFHI